MLYFFYDPTTMKNTLTRTGTPTRLTLVTDEDEVIRQKFKEGNRDFRCRPDFKSYEDATLMAALANRYAEVTTGKAGVQAYVPVDSGPHQHPRYDVIETPKVGDACSYSFNGDTYPDGYITHVTPGTLRIIKTSGDENHPEGHTYYRRKLSSAWTQKGGTWNLTSGHHFEQNPSF